MTEAFAKLRFPDRLSLAWRLSRANWKTLILLLAGGWSSLAAASSVTAIAATGLIGGRFGLIAAALVAHYIFIIYAIGIFSLALARTETRPARLREDLKIVARPLARFGQLFGLVNALICFLALAPQIPLIFLAFTPPPLRLPLQVLAAAVCYLFFALLVCCQAASEKKHAGALDTLGRSLEIFWKNMRVWLSSALAMLLLSSPAMLAWFHDFQTASAWGGNYKSLLMGLALMLPAAIVIIFLYAISFKQSLADTPPQTGRPL